MTHFVCNVANMLKALAFAAVIDIISITILEYIGNIRIILAFMTISSIISKAMTGSSQNICLAP